MLNWQRPYDNNKSLGLTSYRLHMTAKPSTWALFVQNQSCMALVAQLEG